MSKQQVSHERWQEAQLGEKRFHYDHPLSSAYEHYKVTYYAYFKYLGINYFNLDKKTVIEIGPAKLAGLLYCKNYGKSYIVEPIVYEDSLHMYRDKPIEFIRRPYEDCVSPIVDEIWMLNLLPHVKDPDGLVAKAKASCKTIRFFETLGTPTDNEHPFTFSFEDYQEYFGDCTKLYKTIGEPIFHSADCAYGVYQTGL